MKYRVEFNLDNKESYVNVEVENKSYAIEEAWNLLGNMINITSIEPI